MFKKEFDNIFSQLDHIEKKLQATNDKNEKDNYSEKVLQLRRQMDQCIQSWLFFEERVNQLQDDYGLQLPDEIPDGLFKNLALDETSGSLPPLMGDNEYSAEKKEKEEKKIEEEVDFSKMRKDASIVSFKRGLGFYDLYMLEEAIDEFENLVHLEPNFIIGHFLLGHVYSHKQKYESAEKEFRLVLALTEDKQIKGMVYNAMGNIYAERGKYEQALEEFLLALETSDDIKEVYFNLAATYYNLKDYYESINYFELAKNFFLDDWEIYFYLGKCYEYIKQYQKAASSMEVSLKLNPVSSLIHFELGVLYHLLSQREKALYHYQRALELNKEKKARKQEVKGSLKN